MRPVIRIKDTIDRLTSHSGIVHIGTLLQKTDLKSRLDNFGGLRFEQRQFSHSDVLFSHSDVLFSMIALLSIAKPDYDAIELFRPKADFFKLALGLSGCPSAVALRQRIDLLGHSVETILAEESAKLVKTAAPALTSIETSRGPFLPLDIDASPFDTSKTQKEGVSRTYKGCDGYAPIFAYLGAEGYLANLQLRIGSQHCQNGTPVVFPDIEVQTCWCFLVDMPAREVIDLYHDHGTSEQYHSELKTDMDIEWLPSGRFASNSLVLHLAMVAYNALRIIGRQSLEEARRRGIKLPGSRSSKHVERRRIRTVIQDLMYMAGRLIYRGRHWYIGFGCLNPFAELWRSIDSRLRGAPA